MRLFSANPSGGVLIWRNKAYTLTTIEYDLLSRIYKDGPVSAYILGLVVFPNSPEETWQRVVSAYVSKIRKKVGMDVICASKKGYEIGSELQESGVPRPLRLRQWQNA